MNDTLPALGFQRVKVIALAVADLNRANQFGSYMVAPVCYKPPIDDGETRKIAAIHSDFS